MTSTQADQDLATFNRVLEKTLVAECDRVRAENVRLRAALDVARTALLKIERRCEEGRAELTRIHEQALEPKP